MKKTYLSELITLKTTFLMLLFLSGARANSQVTIWSENFNNGCASNCLATSYGGWTVVDNVGGVSGGAPNNWFVSCAEEGIVPPGCGSSCIGDASLHIGADPGAGGDMGASFNETGATNATFRLAVSPTINTTGATNITLSFDFIAFGSAACSDDRGQLRLSTDNGATWPAGYQYCLTSVCCGACNGYSQGQWTTYTLALPAAFNNNPNVRVGYHWRNNGNGSGTDPSIAIDDIRLTTVTPLSVNLIEFYSKANEGTTDLNWKSINETNFSHYDLERSEDGENFVKIVKVLGKGGPNSSAIYQHRDERMKNKVIYYRLKMIDMDGTFEYSNIISVDPNNDSQDAYSIIHSSFNNNFLKVNLLSKKNSSVTFSLYNSLGKLVSTSSEKDVKPMNNTYSIPVNDLDPGIYILKAKIDGENMPLTSKVRRD